MQFNLHTSCKHHHFLSPRKSQETHSTIQKWTTKIPVHPSGKNLKVTNTLRTSINYEHEANPAHLPVVIRRSGRVSRYFWNGNCLELVGVDGDTSSFSLDLSDDCFRELFRMSRSVVRDFFIPKQVNDNYVNYVKWKFLHRVFSSALQVIATQVNSCVASRVDFPFLSLLVRACAFDKRFHVG